VTPIPHRFSGAEAILKGRPPNEELLQSASRKVSEDILRWGGVRSSTSYKVPVVEALFVRAFKEALEGEA
jgi:CO/xanthine dehydrogenase FAD-binding subunit